MDHLEAARRQLSRRLFILVLASGAVSVGASFAVIQLGLAPLVGLLAGLALTAVASALVARQLSRYAQQPLKALWQAILHLSPTDHGVAAPDTDKLQLGRELVTSLTAQVYQLASVASQTMTENQLQLSDLHHNFVAQNLPLPLIVLDHQQNIRFANEAAAQYIGIAGEDMVGKNVYMVLDMSFPSESTFDNWLKNVMVKSATAVASWERVRLNVRDSNPPRLFDLSAYYNRDNREGNETMLVLFDHTKQYSQDDQAISFIALSVHELRTPLTLLRGYIEVFQEELDGKVDEELHSFILKMRAQADQLMAYVNNILNVARVDNDQLELRLEEAGWPDVLKAAIEALNLQAKVRGITLQYKIDVSLPNVAVDRISIQEVINNLIDNAIKYSGDSKVININTSLTKEGLVETTIQDFGVGIPNGVMSNLFTKFYRDHRNRAQIGGTGLGLYLSKAIISAHGGNLWVRSKLGEGSTFGFTLLPYTQLEEAKKGQTEGITRSAHGWIKNHSLYRR
jgi:signal transduction histidine kinase